MKNLLFLFGILISFGLKAEEIAMADTMRANGKIYVVVSVLAVILIGLIAYLYSIDRKISKMEKEIEEK